MGSASACHPQALGVDVVHPCGFASVMRAGWLGSAARRRARPWAHLRIAWRVQRVAPPHCVSCPQKSEHSAVGVDEDDEPQPVPETLRSASPAASAELTPTAERLLLEHTPGTMQPASASATSVAELEPGASLADAARAASNGVPAASLLRAQAVGSPPASRHTLSPTPPTTASPTRRSAKACTARSVRSTSSTLATIVPLDGNVAATSNRGRADGSGQVERGLPDADDSYRQVRVESGDVAMSRVGMVSTSGGAGVNVEEGSRSHSFECSESAEPASEPHSEAQFDVYPVNPGAGTQDERCTPSGCEDIRDIRSRSREGSNVTTSDFEFHLDLPDGSPDHLSRHAWHHWQKSCCESDPDDGGE
jgi:hypothetical protein